VQEEELLNIPVPLVVKATVPVGGLAVPIPLESVTFAVHAVGEPEATDAGLHATVVVVGRRLTLTVALLELPKWVLSGEYVADTDRDPATDGVILTEQLALVAVGVPNVHEPLGVNVTVPVGAVGDADVSVTVAVHVDGWPNTTVVGLHAMVVVVWCNAPTVTRRLKVFVLTRSNESPLYEAVIVSNRVVVPVGV